VPNEDGHASSSQLAEPAEFRPTGDGDEGVRCEHTGRGDRDVAAGRAAREGSPLVRGGQGRVDVPEGLGQSAGVDLLPCGRVGDGFLQNLRAALRFLLAAGDQKAHGRPRDVQIFRRCGVPFVVVAVEQRLGRPSAEHEGELPGGVLRVQDPGVQASGAERGYQMRGVAGDENTTHPHPVYEPGVEAVHRLPHDLVLPGADDLPDPGVEPS